MKAIEGAAGDKDLDEFNTSVCVVGEGQDVKMYTAEEIRAALNAAGIQAGAAQPESAPASPTAGAGAAAKDNEDEDVVMEEA